MIKKKMNVLRFHCTDEMSFTKPDIVDGMKRYAFNPLEPLSDKEIVGFTLFEDPYEGIYFTESNLFQDNLLFCILRRDTRSISSSAIKREMEKEMKKNPEVKLSGKDKGRLKEEITHRLLSWIPFKTELTPFMFDLNSGVGYFCNTGQATYSAFEDIFSRAIGVNVELKGFDCGDDFLSWVWWRLDTNDMNQPSKEEITTGDLFVVKDLDNRSLSGRSSEEEVRLAVANEYNVTKMSVQIIGEDKEMLVDVNGAISSLKIDQSDIPDKDSCSILPLFDRFRSVYAIFDAWAEEYKHNTTSVENFYASKKAWARPSICGADFEDI